MDPISATSPDPADLVPVVLAVTTEANQAQAEQLAKALLDRQLVACVSLQPTKALYHWQGAIAQAEEVQLLLKTDAHQLNALHQAVLELHSYDTPEWIWWPATSSGGYGHWLLACLEPGGVKPDAGPPRPAGNPGGEAPTG